jgi:hypothetical protein
VANRHPVTNRDQPGFAQRTSQLGQRGATGKLHEEFRPEVGRHPPGLHVSAIERSECRGESVIPTELFQLVAVV